MGSTHNKAVARISEATAQAQLNTGERRRVAAEEQLRIGERLLGTDAQVEGNLGGPSEAEVPFIQRYQLNSALADAVEANSLGTKAGGSLQNDVNEANKILERAQAAAASGDLEGANQLRAEAQQYLDGQIRGLGARNAGAAANLFALVTDPDLAARSQLSSPLAQTAGTLVRQGREFLDPNSETSLRYKASLTTNAQRSITASERGALRRGRDLGLARGAARNAYADRAFDQRVREGSAFQRAQVETEAARAFEDFSRGFAERTAAFGQAFLANQSGIREQFQSSLDALLTSSAQLSNAAADRVTAANAAAAGSRSEIQGAGLGALATILSSAAGSIFGPGGALGKAKFSGGGGARF